jgi:two-component system chemotaxis response regulator CheB
MSVDADIARVLEGRRIEAVVIGASAGGVDALLAILPALPAGLRLAVVCILHVPGDRESRLAELFDQRVALPVREAADKQAVEPGVVYFAVPGYHLSIEQDHTFSLSCEPPVHFARPAIDVLMESAADAYGPLLAGVLLTGANQDGADGMARIHACGGLTIVQDPAQAQSAAMPAQAISRCRPHLVLPLERIAALLPTLERP